MENSQIKVKIYTTKNCPFSKKLKDFLYENEVPFEEVDISNDKEKIDECFRVSGVVSTPVIVVKNPEARTLILNGWNEENKVMLATTIL